MRLGPALVKSLLAGCRPAAVLRFVVTVIVTAIKCPVRALATPCLGIRWPFPHVRKEVLERVSPAVAHRDATPSVVLPADRILVCAPLHHVRPYLVNGIARAAMSHVHSTSRFGLQAATTLGVPATKIVAKDDLLVSAVANTLPKKFVVGAACLFKDNKPTETLANKVNLGGHRELILSGVMGRAVTAAPSRSLYPVGVY